jgi:hypothetical protein
MYVSPILGGMIGVDGLLDPEGGATLLTALAPLTTPPRRHSRRNRRGRTGEVSTFVSG